MGKVIPMLTVITQVMDAEEKAVCVTGSNFFTMKPRLG